MLAAERLAKDLAGGLAGGGAAPEAPGTRAGWESAEGGRLPGAARSGARRCRWFQQPQRRATAARTSAGTTRVSSTRACLPKITGVGADALSRVADCGVE